MIFKRVLSFALISSVSLSCVAAMPSDEDFKKAFSFNHGSYEASPFSGKVSVFNWNSDEGIKRLERSKFKGDFYRLAHNFRPQEFPSTCGVATAVSVITAIYELNNKEMPLVLSVPIKIGEKTYGLDYKIFNETNFLNESTDKVIDRRSIKMQARHNKTGEFTGGIDMEELKNVLSTYGVKANVNQVKEFSEKGVVAFRSLVKDVVNSKDKFVIANFNRAYQNIFIGGHFSPIVAFDEESDSVLVLDVAAHKNPWIWVGLSEFYHSMNSSTYSGKDYRGYMVIDTNLVK